MDDITPQEETITDAEIIETPIEETEQTEQTGEQQDEMNILLDIQNAINQNLKKIANLKEDVRPHKEMLDSLFANDPDYAEKAEIAKKAAKDKTAAKKRILSQPQAADLDQKIKEIKQEMTDAGEALSYYLREYQRITGASEFESEDGDLKEIVFIAKLVKKVG